MNLVETIQQWSREEWKSHFNSLLTRARIWVQENGELALIAGFVVGLFISYFFKIFIFLAVIATLCVLAILQIAPEEGQSVSPIGNSEPVTEVDTEVQTTPESDQVEVATSTEKESSEEPKEVLH